jgi:uncharacterized protein (UPF0332 family)
MSLSLKLAVVENYIEKQAAPEDKRSRVGFMLRQLSRLIGSSKNSGKVDADFLDFLTKRAKENEKGDKGWNKVAEELEAAQEERNAESAVKRMGNALQALKDIYSEI